MKRTKPIPADAIEHVTDSLERIAALADLLTMVGERLDPGLLHPRTISSASSMIEREALEIRIALGLSKRP